MKINLLAIALGAVLVWADSVHPIFPDEVYCALGAGQIYTYGSQTHANSWSANCGGASHPECANGWVTIPATTVCMHTTLWEGWSKRFKDWH